MPTKLDARQTILRSTPNLIGSAANTSVDTLLTNLDADLGQLFEDRNILLTQGGLITYTGTQVQFTEALKLEVNSKIAGGAPVIIDLGSTTRNVSASGRMIYAVIDRTAGTATITDDATTLPVVSNANQEVFLLAKRQDAVDGTKRLYFRNGMALNEGQTVRLGASGSGSGAGLGDDINTLRFRASFSDDFSDGPTSLTTAVNSAITTATYNAAGALYRLSYDASKTVTGTGASMTLSATPAYTVAAGDMLIVGSEARRITAVATQTSYTIEAAFSSNPAAAAACVSQAVHTNDVRAHTENNTGLAISAAISDSASTFMLRYRDSAASNDSIWDFPGSALIAASASADNSNWTSPFTRITSASAQEPIRSVPVAGSQFRARFFANATSGSGAVNVLDYKAYLHEDPGTSAGTTMNQAYCLTSGAGSSVNCSVSSATGKTRITTTWVYAVGVNPGAQQGQIEVYLDGKLLPRFIDTTLTSFGFYREISGQVIELDADYSGAGLEVDIKQSVNVVDTTSQNSTNLSYLQDMSAVGFQGFVDESSRLVAVNGTPAAGQFRSDITNRASIPDLANDLRVRMGIDRIPVQQIVQLQNEFGPSGQPVFSALNDDRGLIRFVGNWTVAIDSSGQTPRANTVGDYLEITFFGTGLNLLVYRDATSRDISVSVDGGSASTITNSGSVILAGRNYSMNAVLPIASGLTFGLHTVKIAAALTVTPISGFEVLNESANVNVRPGTAYVGAKKLVSSSASSVAYNSGTFDSILRAGASTSFSTARGARVLTYIKSDGTIGKSAYLTNAASATLSSADHTFEDIARTYYPREFGAGRSDDFSIVAPGGSANLAFTLDDGTTTLAGSNVGFASEGISLSTNNGFLTLTFVGTGLDVERFDDATSAGPETAYTFSIDGVSQGNFASTSSTTSRIQKIVSGLPYGTHTVRISRGTPTFFTPRFRKFIVYQPKKPSLPTGAVELADYNVMADFVAATTGVDVVGSGVLRKASTREFVYTGSGFSAVLDTASSSVGWAIRSATNTESYRYTFFGTGFDFTAYGSSATTTATLTIDGSLYTGSASVTGTATWTPGTGTMTFSTVAGAGRLRVSGLALGIHTIVFTITGAQNLNLPYVDIITPIHSHISASPADLQNTLPIGSESIADSRRLSPVKSEIPQKAWAKAVGISSGVTTTSSVAVPMPDMSITIKTNGGRLRLTFNGTFSAASTANFICYQFYVNGVAVDNESQPRVAVADNTVLGYTTVLQVPAGTHKVDLYWRSNNATTLTAPNVARSMIAEEL